MFKKIKNKKYIIIGLVVLAIALVVGLILYFNKSNQQSSLSSLGTAQPSAEQAPAPESDSTPSTPEAENTKNQPSQTAPPPKWPVQLSPEQATSIEVVVNKKHKLPSNYIPSLASVGKGQLRPEAANAFNSLIAGAKGEGINLVFVSGYRSYLYQEQLYNNYVARDGQAAADTYSARPGHSEHQTGLAVDVDDGGGCELEACFGDRPAGKWVASNAYKYGFVIRYPKSKESVTGYTYEPWHLRYIGDTVAGKVFNANQVLEEYYGIQGGSY